MHGQGRKPRGGGTSIGKTSKGATVSGVFSSRPTRFGPRTSRALRTEGSAQEIASEGCHAENFPDTFVANRALKDSRCENSLVSLATAL